MNVPGVGIRSFAELVNLIDSKKPSSVPIKSAKITSKKTPGLSLVHQSNTAEEMVILLTPLISERFSLSKSITNKIKVQLGIYFQATCIANQSCLGMMIESSSWAVLDSFETETQSLEQVTVLLLLLLTKLAKYSVHLSKEPLHLCTGVIFNNLPTWYDKYMKSSLKEAKGPPRFHQRNQSQLVPGSQDPFFEDPYLPGGHIPG